MTDRPGSRTSNEFNDDLDDCIQTFEQTRDDLEEVERKLASKYGIRDRKHIRRTLIALDQQGTLIEDELVAHWHDLYSSYLDWARAESWNDPPVADPPPAIDEMKQEAAKAAFSLFVDRTPNRFRVTLDGARSQAGAISQALLPGTD